MSAAAATTLQGHRQRKPAVNVTATVTFTVTVTVTVTETVFVIKIATVTVTVTVYPQLDDQLASLSVSLPPLGQL